MTPSEEDDALALSALVHLVYCERSVALVHVLGIWGENAHTTAGRLVHDRVDSGEISTRPDVQILRSVPVRSTRLGLLGVADVVEVWADGRLVPIEYKRGKRARRPGADLQLAAQAMALEEMTGGSVPEGAIFHAKSRRRRVVRVDDELRARTVGAAARLHQIVQQREVPAPRNDERCEGCSLRDACQPDVPLSRGGLARTLRQSLR